MLGFVVFMLGIFVYLDLSLMREQDSALFRRAFHIPSLLWLIYGLFLAMMFVMTPDYFLPFVMVFLLPVYIIKRRRFRRQLPRPAEGEPLPEDPYLAIDAFGILPLWFLGMMGMTLVVKIFQVAVPQSQSPLGELVILTTCSYAIILWLVRQTMKEFPHLTLRQVFALHTNGQPVVKIWVIPALIGMAFAGLSAAFLHLRDHQPSTPLSQIIDSTQSSGILFLFLGVAVLFAPFFEEIIFRGFFFYVIHRFKGPTVALFVIALTFGMMHMDQYWGDWAAIATVTVLGFVLTFLRLKTGSSIPGMVTHYVYNGMMALIPILMMYSSNPAYFEYRMNYHNLDGVKKEELLKKSIAAQPDQYDSYNDLAWLYTEEDRNLEEALVLIEKALEHNPDSYAYLDTKAEVLYDLGRIDEAVAIEEDLAEKYPDDQYIREQLKKFLGEAQTKDGFPGP